MRKLVALAALICSWTSISEARPPQSAAPSAMVRGATQENQLTLSKNVGLLTLTHRRPLNLSPQLARSIDLVNIIAGVARLRDGRCIRLNQRPADGGSANAIVSSAFSECARIIRHQPLVSARCSIDSGDVTIGTWRVGCRASGKRRSVIMATKTDDPSSTMELASLPGEELISVGVIGLHDQGVVLAVGIEPDGTVALSHYLWFDGPYRAIPKGR